MAGQQQQSQSHSNPWEAWCDHLLQGSKKAGIYGLDKQAYCVKPELNISGNFLADAQEVMSKGIEGSKIYKLQLDGNSYFILKADDNHLIAKCGQKGLTVAKAKACLLIGAYDESIQPGTNTNAVLGTRDLLEAQSGQCQQQQQQQKQQQYR